MDQNHLHHTNTELPKHIERMRQGQVVAAISAFCSVSGSAGLEYHSGPITSGPELCRCIEERGLDYKALMADKKLLFYLVIKPHLERGLAVREDVLASSSSPVIAPTAFNMEGWTQDMYMWLWPSVIESQAVRIRMLEGWNLSNGSIVELLLGLMMKAGFRERNTIDLVKENGDALDPLEAYELIFKGAERLMNFTMPTVHFQTLHKMNYLLSDAIDFQDNILQPSGFRPFQIDEKAFSVLQSDVISWAQKKCHGLPFLGRVRNSHFWGDIARARPLKDGEHAAVASGDMPHFIQAFLAGHYEKLRLHNIGLALAVSSIPLAPERKQAFGRDGLQL